MVDMVVLPSKEAEAGSRVHFLIVAGLRQAGGTVTPFANSTSASRSFKMKCSVVCFFRLAMSLPLSKCVCARNLMIQTGRD